MEQIEKEVYFNKYCESCKHFKIPDTDDPCNDCLDNPSNTYSHKPVNWEEKEDK